MEPVPLPDDATDVLFSLFAETGMAEICELQNALATLVHDQHALSRRLAFRKAKALLAQGHAFALLKEDPSFSPEHLADERAFRRASGIVALASMLYQTADDSEPEYASLIEKPPCPLSRLFLWMDFVHPMRRHPIPPHKVSGIILSICSIYSSLACYRHELFVSSLRENPRAMLQIIAIWLHYPLYLQGANGGRLTAAASVVLAARPLLQLFFGNPRTYMHSTFFAELNALAGRRRYVLDSIASQSHFLTSISAVSPTWTWLWRDHLLVALMLTHSPEFYGVLVPRGVLRALMSCVTKLIDNTTSRDRDLRETAAVASDLILSFLKHTNDTRNVLRAVKAGLFPFLRTLDAAFDTHMESVAALKNYMADCVSLPSILRPLVKANPELAQETPQSDLTSRFARLYDNARRHQVLYGRLQDVNPWILHIPCGNVFKGYHEPRRYICPCGTRVYCSINCQREDWRRQHRHSCCASGGVWGLGDTITLSDARYVLSIAQAFFACNIVKIGIGLRKVNVDLDTSRPTESGLTRIVIIDLGRATEPGDDFSWRVDRQRLQHEPGGPGSKVHIQVCLCVGGSYPQITLPVTYDMELFTMADTIPQVSAGGSVWSGFVCPR